MRSLIAGFVVLTLSTLALTVTIERSYDFHDPQYCAKIEKLKTLVHEKPNRPFILVVGSSRTEVGLNGLKAEERLAESSDRAPTVFNFGFAGGGPVIHTVYLERLIEAGIVPDAIVLESLSRTIEDGPNGPQELIWLSQNRFLKGERRKLQQTFGGATEQWTDEKTNNPWRKASNHLLFYTAPYFVPVSQMGEWNIKIDSHGWVPFIGETIDAETRKSIHKRAETEYRDHLGTFAPKGMSAECYRHYVERCRELNIPLRIVVMPESSTFRSWYGPGVNDRYLTYLRSLDVPIVDARTWIDDAGFADGHHLYSQGVTDFTKQITDEVLAPLVAEMKR